MIGSRDLDRDGQFRVELLECLGAWLEQVELKPATEARLIDVHQQRLHFRRIRQLLQQRAE